VLLVTIAALLFVLMPFLFWRQTWFGRRLTDQQISQYLEDTGHGRRIQHALVQVSERMLAGDPSVVQWYPGILRAAGNSEAAVRNTAAWTMGQAPHSDLLHSGLRSLLRDPDLQVRRNAALSLVRFGDVSGHAELAGVLKPFEIRSTQAGSVRLHVRPGERIGAGASVATVRREDGTEERFQAPFQARVSAILVTEGTLVGPGSGLVALSSPVEDVWEALRGLYVIGDVCDLPDVERFQRKLADMPERVAQQAGFTARAIRSRQGHGSSH
jgi:biotin carboxyl carrier protein